MEQKSLQFARLNADFYQQNTETIAKALLGKVLIVCNNGSCAAGVIAETEAYVQSDPASHSYRGKTERNGMMFGTAGQVYVYFIYGTHYCLNVVTERAGNGAAVLIRSLRALPNRRNSYSSIYEIDSIDESKTTGPANLCRELKITKADNGINLLTSVRIWIADGGIQPAAIFSSQRIGISKNVDAELRFLASDFILP